MSNKIKLKKELHTELKKLKTMSSADKAWYLWEYYKLHMLVLFIIIGILAVIGSTLYRTSFQTVFSCAVLNNRSSSEANTKILAQEFRDYLGLDSKEVLEFDTGMFMDYGSTSQLSHASMTKISTMITEQDLDVMIADRRSIDHFAEAGALIDLSAILPVGLYTEFKDQFYYAADQNGASIPCALPIKDTKFKELTNVVIEPPFLAIIANSKQTNNSLAFLRYLFELDEIPAY